MIFLEIFDDSASNSKVNLALKLTVTPREALAPDESGTFLA